MADEDFEIDIYGDAPQDNRDRGQDRDRDRDDEAYDDHRSNGHDDDRYDQEKSRHDDYDDDRERDHHDRDRDRDHDHDRHYDDDDRDQHHQHQSPAPQQGVKRKGDDRPIDHGATTAITISDLSWWVTDDSIRGWAYEAHCEDELKDITFSEHKVNGKSKGQAYLEFASPQAATAVKRHIDSFGGSGAQRRHGVVFASGHNNPFKTLPKDTSARQSKESQPSRPNTNYNDRGQGSGGDYRSGNYRGRGGFASRGGMGQNNFNRNFSGGMGGFNNNNMGGGGGGGGFNGGGGMGGGFNNNMGGGFNNRVGFTGGGGMRGGPGGMRGGRGGMGNMGMGMGPMGGMPMGGMPNPMGMMGGGMQGFQGMPQPFNPGFFGGGGNQGGGEWGNPHGAKRPRPE